MIFDDQHESPHPMGAPAWLVKAETSIINDFGEEIVFTMEQILERWDQLRYWGLNFSQGYAHEMSFLPLPYGFDPAKPETLNAAIALHTIGREQISEIVAIDKELAEELPQLTLEQSRITAIQIRVYRQTERELERILRRFPKGERRKALAEIKDLFATIENEIAISISSGRIHHADAASHRFDGQVPGHLDLEVHARFEELDLQWLYREQKRLEAIQEVVQQEVSFRNQVIQKSRLSG